MSSKKKKIAVVGAGIYGTTIAIELAKSNYVDLFEAKEDILMGASMVNQFRLHKGYHYPRSTKTVLSCLQAEKSFSDLYGDALISTNKHYYAIASEKSLTSGKTFLNFCDTHNLRYAVTDADILNQDAISLTVEVQERLIDPDVLKKTILSRLQKTGVNLHLKTRVGKNDLLGFDHVVICAYSGINDFLKTTSIRQKEYQFEVCEKILVKLPSVFKNISLVIMDGPFMCLDPFGQTGLHLLGNVAHAIHRSNTGIYPSIPKPLRPLLNSGFIPNPPVSNFKKFIQSAQYFIPQISEAKYHSSLFTIRTVIPHKDKTDERLTFVTPVSSSLITVFSGKIGNCVEAAKEVATIINS